MRKTWDSQSRQWDNETWHSQYSKSDIDAWNNGEYKARFSSRVQELMGETAFYCTQGGTTFDNWSGALITLKRAIFILSVTEFAGSEYGFNQEGTKLPISDVLMAIGNSEWTRSAYLNNPAQAGNRHADNLGTGVIGASPTTLWLFARQAFTLPGSTLVDESLNLIES